MMKKFYLLFFLSSFFLSGTLNAAEFTVDGIKYYVTSVFDNTVEVVWNDPAYSGDITIPASVTFESEEYSVTAIGMYAFSNCEDLNSVTLPNSIEIIDREAFNQCYNLTSINIPESVTAINAYAFYMCSSLTSINLGSGVSDIRTRAFALCPALTEITVNENNPDFFSVNGIVYSRDKSILVSCPGAKTSVTIEEGTTTIAETAFYENENLISLVIPESLTTIDDYGLFKCRNIESITSYATSPPSVGMSGMSFIYNATVYVPEASITDYENASNWSYYEIIALNTTSISEKGIKPTLRIYNKTVMIEGLENKPVIIYDISGKIIERIAKAGISQKITLHRQGIYILKSDDYITKIAVK